MPFQLVSTSLVASLVPLFVPAKSGSFGQKGWNSTSAADQPRRNSIVRPYQMQTISSRQTTAKDLQTNVPWAPSSRRAPVPTGPKERAKSKTVERRSSTAARRVLAPTPRRYPSPGRAFAGWVRQACPWTQGCWRTGTFALRPRFARPTCRSDRPGSTRRARAPSESRRCAPAWAPSAGASAWIGVSCGSSSWCSAFSPKRKTMRSSAPGCARPCPQKGRACLRAQEIRRWPANA